MPKTTTVGNADLTDPEKRQAAITKGYSNATAILRTRHLTEFNAIRVEETKKLGYDWTPAPTEEEKAAATVRELLAAHPGLEQQIFPTAEVVDDDPAPVAD